MPTLTIHSDAGKELLRIQIKQVDSDEATIAILRALREVTPQRKTRSDKGMPRKIADQLALAS